MLLASILGHLSAKTLAGLLAGAMVAGGSAAAATGSLPAGVQTRVSQAAGSLGIQIPSDLNPHADNGLAKAAAAIGHHGIGKTVSAIARSGAGAYAVVSATPAGTKIATTPAAKILASGVGKHRAAPAAGTGGTGTGGTGGTGTGGTGT